MEGTFVVRKLIGDKLWYWSWRLGGVEEWDDGRMFIIFYETKVEAETTAIVNGGKVYKVLLEEVKN